VCQHPLKVDCSGKQVPKINLDPMYVINKRRKPILSDWYLIVVEHMNYYFLLKAQAYEGDIQFKSTNYEV
jgi:hypothetical protein